MSSCPFCSHEISQASDPGEKAIIYACTACKNPMVLRWEAGGIQGNPLERTKDIRQLAPPGSIGGEILAKMPEAIEKLPVLPQVAQRVLSMVADPEATMTDVAVLIRQDPIIALKVMQLANSPIYGGLHEIKDLSAACARLGMKNISNAVQTIANSNLYVTGDKRLQAFMMKLWRHSVATAHCANELASILSMPGGESVFLAGLIHDVGKVLLLDIVAEAMSGAVSELRKSPQIFAEVVTSFHMLVGLHVVQHWNMPPEFSATTYCHHDPALTPNEDLLAMTHVVALADTIAKAEGFGIGYREDLFLVTHPSARYLNLTDIKIAALRVDLADTLEKLLEVVEG